ncbi:MAG: SIR2 family protein, partial [Planctomycetales bacterium]|nr:SIR2 family protein [Planctomycetales bacterium]
MITTNYDLLLEGAWRESGFEWDDHQKDKGSSFQQMPRVPIPNMARISSPHDFQLHGKAVGTSLIVKVHGCADKYRTVRNASDVSLWRNYLRSIVFTYREIQNWRTDSWSRDFLATTQRTRAVAFSGYSLQDPVIHDAFRTVYEEMSTVHTNHQSPEESDRSSPAYFFGAANETSFHANEVLTAATFAVGIIPKSSLEHENYFKFHFLKKAQPAVGAFPNLDDLFRATYHRVIRKSQSDCLHSDLRAALMPTIGRGPLPSEQKQLLKRFEQLLDCETTSSAGASKSGKDNSDL